MIQAQDILSFWFGELNEDGTVAPEVGARWWKKDAAFDALIGERFGDLLEQAPRGELAAWTSHRVGRLALVLVLDQFSRNVYRDTPRAFANDAQALAIANDGVTAGDLQTLAPIHAYFLVMPFMHAEDVAAQRKCVALFQELADAAPSEPLRKTFTGGVDFAERHRVIVERFGRFPHRNAILGRESTEEEIQFLKEPGSSF